MSDSTSNAREQAQLALGFLAAVEDQFLETPEHYRRFISWMTQYNKKEITTMFLVEQVSGILFKFPQLIDGFNSFLPPGWHVTSTLDEAMLNSWTVTINTTDDVFLKRYSEVDVDETEWDHDFDPSASNEEFHQMVDLVKDVQERYRDNPSIYQEFLATLDPNKNSASREAILLSVKTLLRDTPDLVARFKVMVEE